MFSELCCKGKERNTQDSLINLLTRLASHDSSGTQCSVTVANAGISVVHKTLGPMVHSLISVRNNISRCPVEGLVCNRGAD